MRFRPARGGRPWALLQLGGVGLLLATVAALGISLVAGASPASGDIVPGSALAVAPFTANEPFDSGQSINVVMPANSAFAGDTTTGINILECSAPNGVPPTNPADCDGNTIQGNTLFPAADGSLSYSGYQVFALPDSVTLGEGSGGVTCGNTAATECILYVGQNQLDFTKPHLWSQPFYIDANGNDLGAHPGDGSPPPAATTPSATLSTVVASPTTATADGSDFSTVTITLLGTGSVPVAGKAVSLASTGSATVSGPTPATTNASGQTTFTVTDTTAESVTLSATDTTDSVPITQKPSVTFAAPAVDAAHSTVVASPSNPPADGTTPTTVTVTLYDQASTPKPIAGKSVTLAATGSAVISPSTPVVTNASGVATFTATDTTAETVTFTATDTTDTLPIPNKATATFGTLSVDATHSTVTVSSPVPVGGIGTTAVVTLLSATNSPVAGKAVSLQASSSTAVVGAPSAAVTGANGQVSFQVTDTVAESVTLTAKDTTDSITLNTTPTVVFATASPSGTTSTVIANPTTAPADGETQVPITVTMKDSLGAVLPGKTITLASVATSPTDGVQTHPISVGGTSTPGVTDANGVVVFETDDTTADAVTYTATDTTDNIVLAQTVTITFTTGPADPGSLGTTVTANPTNPPSDGKTATTITVTMTDLFSNPVSGESISLKALNGGSVITPSTPVVTNASGVATFTATDSTAEVVTYQATDVTDSNTPITSEAVVTFGTPPVPPADATFSSVVAQPATVPANGTTTATVSVLLYDDNGGPVSGKTVTLTAAGGSSKVTATNGTTNNSGMATFAVSDTTAEAVKFTADDTTDSVSLSAIPVTVTFTAASTTSSSTTTTTTTAGGSTTTTTTSASGATTSGLATSAGATGNSGSGTSGSGASLATTGASTLLLWLAGIGALLVGVGTLGRRRFKGAESRQ